MVTKIDYQLSEGLEQFKDKSMSFCFNKMMIAICKHLEAIILEEDDEDREFITANSYTNGDNLDQPAYLTKNTRIETGESDDEDETASQPRRTAAKSTFSKRTN